MSADELLARLDKVTPRGKGKWMARCPAHDDKTPSLAVAELQDGRILVKCMAGCPTHDVLTSVGLSLADLFPDGGLGEFKGWEQLQREASLRKEQKQHDNLSLERTVLAICESDRKQGKRLSQADLKREREAWIRIRRANANNNG